MDENEITEEIMDENENEDVSYEDIEVASWLPTILVGGVGMLIGYAGHKFIVPACKKAGEKVKEKLLESLTKTEDGETVEIVEEEDSKN